MLATSTKEFYTSLIESIREEGLYKSERLISTPQSSHVGLQTGKEFINLCANNYLGLASHPDIIAAAHKGLDDWGFGMASVRFICGTQTIHKELEKKVSQFLGMEDTILYSSCFDANAGLFETLLGPEDAIISDELNHASIIDGIRLCKAKRFRYLNNNMQSLEKKLMDASDARIKLIATDGVFSMDGTIANLKDISVLAKKYGALLMVDDSHAVGVLGEHGRGSHEHCGVMADVDIITGTLGKALGGASGGFTSAKKEIVDVLRQRSRPYLFSNSLAPSIVQASIESLKLIQGKQSPLKQLKANTQYFCLELKKQGFEVSYNGSAIIPIMLGDAVIAQKMAEQLLEKGIYVIGFFYPVVPLGKARIRTQISAAHSEADLKVAAEEIGSLYRQLTNV
jgi:glycine C-acetyltransferase